MNTVSRGQLVIISGPSGAGKSTVLKEVLHRCPLPLVLSVSATTRLPRDGEIDGKHYHFLTRDEFRRRREAGAFLEWKEVYGRGDYYGTLRETVTAGLEQGKWVILEIDVQGAMMVLEQHPAITIFLHPGSPAELEQRLRLRATETEASLQRRLAVAQQEMEMLPNYQHEVINDSVDQATEEICRILQDHPC